MRIHYAVGDFGACGWYRCRVPGVALRDCRHHQVLLSGDFDEHMRALRTCDVLVLHRQHTPHARRLAEAARELEKAVVFEMDDNIWRVPPSNQSFKTARDPAYIAAVEEVMSLSQLVTTTCEPLAEVAREHHDSVVVLPNMLPREFWSVNIDEPGDEIVIGFAGGDAHAEDVRLVVGALHRILAAFPEVSVHMCGVQVDDLVRHPRTLQLGWVPIEEYAERIKHFDIAIAPLEDSAFNRCRSDLKFIEFGCLGIPGVFSNVEPFSRSVTHGETGMLASTEDDWFESLSVLVTDAQLRTRLGAEAQKVAYLRFIEDNIMLWERAYKQALALS